MSRILRKGGIPVPVPDLVIERNEDRGRDFCFVRPGPMFTKGARVRIGRGPVAGLEAVFDRHVSRSGWLRILLQLAGHERSLELDGNLELA